MDTNQLSPNRSGENNLVPSADLESSPGSTDSSLNSSSHHHPYSYQTFPQNSYYGNSVLRPPHMTGNPHLMKTSNAALLPSATVTYSTEKDYEDQRYPHSSCDTQDYAMDGGGGLKSPTNSSIYGDHSPNQTLNE